MEKKGKSLTVSQAIDLYQKYRIIPQMPPVRSEEDLEKFFSNVTFFNQKESYSYSMFSMDTNNKNNA